jgi:hypothetical protein
MSMQAASVGMSAAGSLFQGVAGWQAGKQNRAAMYAAATNAERVGAAQEARIRDSVRSAVGEQVAAQWGNGMEGGTGSAIDAVHESLVQGALDALNVRQEAANKASSLRTQGDMAAQEGENSLVSGLLGAGSKYLQAKSDWAVAYKGKVSTGTQSQTTAPTYYNPMTDF